MLSARAETRKSREKGEVRDLIKRDIFLIEIVDGRRLGLMVLSVKCPTFISNNHHGNSSV